MHMNVSSVFYYPHICAYQAKTGPILVSSALFWAYTGSVGPLLANYGRLWGVPRRYSIKGYHIWVYWELVCWAGSDAHLN